MKFKTLNEDSLPDVELILTAGEATVLTAILGKISGYANDDSPRKFTSDLYNVLHNNGYRTRPYGGNFSFKGKSFSLTNDMRVDKV